MHRSRLRKDYFNEGPQLGGSSRGIGQGWHRLRGEQAVGEPLAHLPAGAIEQHPKRRPAVDRAEGGPELRAGAEEYHPAPPVPNGNNGGFNRGASLRGVSQALSRRELIGCADHVLQLLSTGEERAMVVRDLEGLGQPFSHRVFGQGQLDAGAADAA